MVIEGDWSMWLWTLLHSNLGNPLRVPGFVILIVTRRNYYYAYGVEALVLTKQLNANVIRSYYLVVDYHIPGGPKAVDPSFSHPLDRTLRFLHYCEDECNHEGTLCLRSRCIGFDQVTDCECDTQLLSRCWLSYPGEDRKP